MNVALVLPTATVTLAGTVAADELSLRVTTAPPDGAGALKVTVPWEETPAVTLVGDRDSVLTTGFATTLRVTVATLLLAVPSLAV